MTEAILNWTSAGDYRHMVALSDAMKKRRYRRTMLAWRPAITSTDMATMAYFKANILTHSTYP